MYGAKIELGWFTRVHTGENAVEIMRKIEENQNFDCLILMGCANEKTENGRQNIAKIVDLVNKYREGIITMEDIAAIDIHLSTGNFICHGVAEGEEAISKLDEN